MEIGALGAVRAAGDFFARAYDFDAYFLDAYFFEAFLFEAYFLDAYFFETYFPVDAREEFFFAEEASVAAEEARLRFAATDFTTVAFAGFVGAAFVEDFFDATGRDGASERALMEVCKTGDFVADR